MATLRLVPATGNPIEISKDEVLVGREPTCDVVVADGSVSRRHARLVRGSAGWRVVDQGSANGTYVDSHRVSDAALKTGQDLRFGAVSYRVEIDETLDLGLPLAPSVSAEATVMQEAAAPPPLPPRVTPPPPPPLAPPLEAPPSPPPPPPRPTAPPPPAGASRFPSRPPVSPPSGAAASPPRRGKGPLFWVGLGCGGCLTMVVLLVVVVVGGFYAFTKGPTDAIEGQLAEIRQGEVDAAYARLSEAYRQRVTQRDFARLVEAHPVLKQNAEARCGPFSGGSVSRTNDVARVSCTLVSTSGAREVARYELAKESGEWKITSLRVGDAEPIAAPEEPKDRGAAPLDVTTTLIRKEPGEAGTKVTIRVRVTGFALRPEGDQFAIDLAEDLETLGPDGQRIESLSQKDFKVLRDTTPSREGSYADFETSLTLPRAQNGEYHVRLTIRDRVGGSEQLHEVAFALP